ncbi:MAG TPA: hypothetical protein VGV89_03500 [Thermoplasmata archaeon]|nr:hypothetical protein [Thermoplasmata archaeon]
MRGLAPHGRRHFRPPRATACPALVAPGVAAGLVGIASLQMLDTLPTPNTNFMLLLVVGVPAWATAIFTLVAWYRYVQKRRETRDADPIGDDGPPRSDG